MFMLSLVSYSQGYYEIKSLGTNYSSTDIQTAFNSANFCGLHYEVERNLIVLDDGTEVELLAANEIQNFDSNCVFNSGSTMSVCTYSIVSGVILRGCDNKLTPLEEKVKTNN